MYGHLKEICPKLCKENVQMEESDEPTRVKPLVTVELNNRTEEESFREWIVVMRNSRRGSNLGSIKDSNLQ